MIKLSKLRIKYNVCLKWLFVTLCIIGFILIAEDVPDNELVDFDSAIYGGISLLRCIFFSGFFRVMTALVSPVVLAIVTIGLIFLFKQRKYWIPILGNLGLTILLNITIKNRFMRERPPEAMRLIHETGYSFPSGHAMVSASFYGFIIFLIWQTNIRKKKKIWATIGLIVTILLIGCSRIYLGVHYGSDVIGGFLVSAVYLVIYTSIVKWYFDAGEVEIWERKNDIRNGRLIMSFEHAFDGIASGLKNERNMMIHFSAMILVIVFGTILKISPIEWCICLLLCGLVIALELLNTAIEATLDLVSPEIHPKVKLAKDTAAGAVLVCAIMAAVVGAIIFIPKLWVLLSTLQV